MGSVPNTRKFNKIKKKLCVLNIVWKIIFRLCVRNVMEPK